MKHGVDRNDPVQTQILAHHAGEAEHYSGMIHEILNGKEKGEYSERINAIAEASMDIYGMSKEETIDAMLANAKTGLQKETDVLSSCLDWLLGK